MINWFEGGSVLRGNGREPPKVHDLLSVIAVGLAGNLECIPSHCF